MSQIELHWVQQPGSRVRDMLRPATVAEALEMLQENPGLRPVAGGTDLLLELARDGRGEDVALLDLTAISELRVLDLADPTIARLGAGVTHADLLASVDAHTALRPLAQACLEVGSPQLRNRATIVGNLVTASPANDTISALVALGATISVVGLGDDNTLQYAHYSIGDFYTGFRQTVLSPTDLVDAVIVPTLTDSQRGLWVKAGLRKAQAISVVHAGFVLDFAADGAVADARIALGSVGPTVELSAAAADVLIGSPLSPDRISQAAQAAADSVSPIDDGRATADYRSDSVITVVSRALAVLAAGREAQRWPVRVPLLSTRPATDRGGLRAPRRSPGEGKSNEISVHVNGARYSSRSAGSGTLLEWLRDNAGTGTKEGCAEGECGACTVRLDSDAVMSCLVPAAQADGAEVTSIEGLATGDAPHPMQQSFVDKFAVQCGFCIPGFVMAAATLADELDSPPTRDEIELALSGNLCRCTGYYNIIDAVHSVFDSGVTGGDAR